MTKHFNYLIIIILATCITAGCSKKQYTAYTNADGYNEADSIVSVEGDARNWPRVLELCDSFAKTGDLSEVKVIFYKTIAYNLTGQYRSSLNLYYKLAKIDVRNLHTQADIEAYTYSYKDYVRLLREMRRYDRALRQAYIVNRKLVAAGQPTFINHHDIAQIIGECQLFLGQNAEAARHFNKSLKGMRQRLAVHDGPLDLRECQKTMNAIATIYMRRGMLDEVEPWLLRQDTLYAKALAHPQADSVYIDEMKADINYTRAMWYNAKGQTINAEKCYAHYLSTKTSKQTSNIINSCRYLQATHRYEEAARNYTKLDSYMHESGYEADLENIGRFMIPKFFVNLQAGRQDSALRVATQIATVYDSALTRQKIIDADLLATVYDTEGKDRQIAEQRAQLTHQQMLWVLGVSMVLIILLHLYLIQRRKAYNKLNETNKQLLRANERAEESSRMKTKFIQQISHEVRTPLNVLSGFAQVLAAPDIEINSEELQSISRKIVENSERITRLVDKMLDLSLVNCHQHAERVDKVKTSEVAYRAVQQSGISSAKHLDFKLQLGARTDSVLITTNLKAAIKALTLLLDNAQKFTHPLAYRNGKAPNEKPHVTLSAHIESESGYVSYIVEDTGIGIPAKQAENIFNEFVQLDEYTDGTGIGLSIARALTRYMDGDIVLDTTYTKGARFVMKLPL